ncbi:PdaC/SigV domain-containing protein [Paenibacillus pseudetheri]|uniref:Uncharacterized protein n=1 Tax=Paenibacillus pseudetheri TaxID=2897682 RepID=A0ABN8FU87_9BACL|nr:DUF4163 domain-containing protein [Paenibacillus pseudetheri]CAH1058696.1 hypothetical protein PAECIP111894_04874 [Paenibacillus pseudetheri]
MMNISKEIVRKWGIGLMSAGLLLGGGVLPGEIGYAASDQTQSKVIASSIVLKANGMISRETGILQEGKVWIPITFMRDVLRLPFTYDKKENAYTIGKGTTKVKLMLSSYGTSIWVNNYYIREYEGKLINNRLYVPSGLLNDYLGYKVDWSRGSSKLNVVNRPQNTLTVTTETYAKDRKEAFIQLDYPKIGGLSNSNAQQAMNDILKESAMRFAAGAEKDISNRSGSEPKYTYDIDYVVTYNQNGVISLVMSQYSDTGGAHGMTNREAFTFSLKDGKRLLLGDLFGANPNYKQLLNAKLNKLVKAEESYLGGFNGLNTEKYFYLKDDQVVLFFQLYEYTAYAAGFPEYTFTFKELLPEGGSPFAAIK